MKIDFYNNNKTNDIFDNDHYPESHNEVRYVNSRPDYGMIDEKYSSYKQSGTSISNNQMIMGAQYNSYNQVECKILYDLTNSSHSKRACETYFVDIFEKVTSPNTIVDVSSFSPIRDMFALYNNFGYEMK